MNLPNLLTVVRLVLIPVYIVVFFSHTPHSAVWSLIILALAGATDVLDGYLARKYKWITELGSMLDPLADKLMMLAVILSFVLDQRVSWLVAGLLIIRDLGMIFASLFFVSRGKKTVPATIWGKLNTVLYYIALIALMFRWPYGEAYLWGVILFSFLTSFLYMRDFKALNR